MGHNHNRETVCHYPRPSPVLHLAHHNRRRWPPSPFVEDEEASLAHEYKPAQPDSARDEGRMRGSLDQQPIILEVDQPTSKVHNGRRSDNDDDATSLKPKSSNDSFGPSTPLESIERNDDRRYIYIPKEGIEIPLTYDEPKKLNREAIGPAGTRADALRGKKENPPKLDTKIPQVKDTLFTPLISARAPSPYSYPSSPAAKSRFSGEYFLSPDTLSPKAKFTSDANNAKFKKTEGGHIYTDPMARRGEILGAPTEPLERPAFNRHVSASAYPGQPLHSPSHSRSTRYDFSSDDSDDDFDRYTNVRSDKRSNRDPYDLSNRPRHASALHYEESMRRDLRDGQGNITPPSRPTSTFSARTLPVGVPGLGALGPDVTNALLSDPHWKKPSPVSRVSPSTSPYSSPPRTPRVDTPRYGETLPVTGIRLRPSSRPTTPTSADQIQPRSPSFEAFHESRSVAQPSPGVRSSRASPLPSSQFNRPTSSSGPRIDIYAPSPANKQAPFTTADDRPRVQSGEEMPFILSPAPQMARRSRSRSRSGRQTPSSFFESPPGTQIRARSPCGSFEVPQSATQAYASTMHRERSPRPTQNQALTMPSCPRPAPVAGYDDWYTLNGMNGLNICPTCRDHVVSAGYGGYFRPSPSRLSGYETRCDFSIPWIRMAWLLTLKENRRDANLLYALAEVAVREPPCPGKSGAAGPWFHLADSVADRPVSNFDVCPYCVRSLETIFPMLQGVFQHTPSATHQTRICDLWSGSKRFAIYVDLLEEIAKRAVYTRKRPDTRRFVDLARTMASIRECPRDDMIVG